MNERTSSPADICWDLGDLYPEAADQDRIDDQAEALRRAGEFGTQYRGRIAELPPPELATALQRLEEILALALRPLIYGQLRFAADTSIPARGGALQAAQERYSAIQQELIFFDLEWLALDDATAADRTDAEALRAYRHYLQNLRKQKPHVLSEPEEKVVELLSNTGRQAFVRLFDEVVNGIVCAVPDEDGPRQISLQEALSLLHSPVRETRRTAAQGITEALEKHSRVLTYIFNTTVRGHADLDALRDRPYPMYARHLDNEVSGESVDALLTACEARLDLVARYYELKKRLLGLDRLYDYDRYAPVSETLPECPFSQAQEIVLSAYGDFSPEMADIAGRFFSEHWIDATLRPGKSGGAFCAATLPTLHPYVLLNYTGRLRDVMTLAHELGHGVHQYLSRPHGLFQFHAPLVTSEAASTFGEMLVFRNLMDRHDDPRTRLGLLCGKLEDSFATIFRQALMTRFEQSLHEARRNQGELDAAAIGELWMKANRPMFGQALELTADYAKWWSYIPHFIHSPFYVYAYSFGELLVFAMFRRYELEGAAFVPKYLQLLASGNSDSPTALLSKMDLDIADPAFWEMGLSFLADLLEQAERLAADLGTD